MNTLQGGSGKHLWKAFSNFKRPDGWNRWKRRFEQCCVASELAESSEERHVCTLLYCLGEDAENVLSSTNIMAAERKIHTGRAECKPMSSLCGNLLNNALLKM